MSVWEFGYMAKDKEGVCFFYVVKGPSDYRANQGQIQGHCLHDIPDLHSAINKNIPENI